MIKSFNALPTAAIFLVGLISTITAQRFTVQPHGMPSIFEHVMHTGLLDAVDTDNSIYDLHSPRFGNGASSRVETLLSIGCTPVSTLHKAISRSDNQTTLTLFVSQSCAETNLPISNPKILIDSGDLVVTADSIPSQRLQLDPRANLDAVKAMYDNATNSLFVTIPLTAKHIREVPLEIVTVPQKVIKEGFTNDEAKDLEVEQREREEEAQREAFIKSSVQALERELAQIKGQVSSSKAEHSEGNKKDDVRKTMDAIGEEIARIQSKLAQK